MNKSGAGLSRTPEAVPWRPKGCHGTLSIFTLHGSVHWPSRNPLSHFAVQNAAAVVPIRCANRDGKDEITHENDFARTSRRRQGKSG